MIKPAQTIVARLLDSGGFTTTEMGCRTRKEAKERCKYYLSDEYPHYSETTHERLKTEKAEVLVNGECEWDCFK